MDAKVTTKTKTVPVQNLFRYISFKYTIEKVCNFEKDYHNFEKFFTSKKATFLKTTARLKKTAPLKNSAPSKKSAPLENTTLLKKTAPLENTAPLKKTAPLKNVYNFKCQLLELQCYKRQTSTHFSLT